MGRGRDERGVEKVLTSFCFQGWIGVQWGVVVAMGGIAKERVKVFRMNGREFWALEGVSDGEVEGESEAYYRICAARTGRAFPVVFELLERREVSLTTLALVGKYLTLENHLELLAEVRGKTKRQVLEVLALRWPRAEVASAVQRLPVGVKAVAADSAIGPFAAAYRRDGWSRWPRTVIVCSCTSTAGWRQSSRWRAT
jgi:hypothetical protein